MQSGREKVIDYFASQCDYCGSSIVSGQRWVREKIFDPALTSGHARVRGPRKQKRRGRSSSPADRMPQQCSSVANLFPVRPGVTLLFVFLSSEGFDAKALRTLVADGDFRRLAAHIANVVCVFGLGVGSQRDYLHTLPPF